MGRFERLTALGAGIDPGRSCARRERTSARALLTLVMALTAIATACSSSAPPDAARPSDSTRSKHTPPVAIAAAYRPAIDPDDFGGPIGNPLFPLRPGTAFRLRGDTQDGIEHEELTVTNHTKQILGAAVLGVTGDEVIHGVLNMMNAGASYPTLQWAVPVHPTVSELIPTVLGDLKPVL